MQRAGLLHNPNSTQDHSKDATSSRRPQNSLLSPSHARHPLFTLQRSIGNQALLRMLRQQSAEGSAPVGDRPSWDLSHIPIYPSERSKAAQRNPFQTVAAPPAVQPKLEVGAVDDPLEHEADRVANEIIRMPDPDVSVTSAPAQVSRKCDACEEDKQKLQRKPAPMSKTQTAEAPAVVREVLQSPGQPLDTTSRAYFEPRFGRDLGHVRVHTDARAANSAQAVNALAYTVGHQVIVGFPGTVDRKHLLAHELVHVLQQSSTPAKSPLLQRQGTEELVHGEEGESLPGGPGMERTVPETKRTEPGPTYDKRKLGDAARGFEDSNKHLGPDMLRRRI